MDFMPAFTRHEGSGWKQTPEAKKVLGIIKDSGAADFNIQPAPSVLMQGDRPMWGSGGGVHYTDGTGTFVDPIGGSVATAAHEAGHAGFMTDLGKQRMGQEDFRGTKNMQGQIDYVNSADQMTGSSLRAAYETMSKPIMLEEANAQGVAAGAMNKAGFPMDNNGWQEAKMRDTGLAEDIPATLTYPGQYRFGGGFDQTSDAYSNGHFRNDQGHFDMSQSTPSEYAEFQKIQRSHIPAMKRQFQAGFERIK